MTREEAKERIMSRFKYWALDDKDTEAIQTLIPELHESEDERIRKGLIEALKVSKTVGELKFVIPYPEREECIAYLEKQKEQKHPNGCFTCDEYKKGYEEGRRNGFTAGYNKAMKEVEQKEQKPWKVGANAYFTPEQKSAEWSEEDEDMLNSCISSIEEAKENRYAYKETDGDTSYDHEIAWLKSLRPVSKESLQPHWKPSEEQMSAFKGYIEDFQARAEAAVGGWNNFDVMIRLYEQLKKL